LRMCGYQKWHYVIPTQEGSIEEQSYCRLALWLSWYKEQTLSVRWNVNYSEPFSITNKVRQGACSHLSSLQSRWAWWCGMGYSIK